MSTNAMTLSRHILEEEQRRLELAGDLQIFWGDERHVPPDQADSNYRMAHEVMLAHVPVPVENVHLELNGTSANDSR